MLFTDTYKTLAEPAHSEIRERASRFMAFAIPCNTENEAKAFIQTLIKDHPKANHHCWALVLGPDASFQKSSDDREPANSAGKPILRQILAAGITNCCIVVVRYFGGKLLGVPGLIAAYGSAASEALQAASTVQKHVTETYHVQAPYEHLNDVYIALHKYDATVLNDQSLSAELSLIFEVRKALADALLKELKDNRFIQVTCVI